jgi:hypothetical protein
MDVTKRTQALVVSAVALALVTPAAAAEETGEALFRKVLLGHCYAVVTGKTLLKTDIDVSAWNKVAWSEGSNGGGLTSDARTRTTQSGSVIVDRTPDGCFVQAGGVDSAALARTLKEQLQSPPFGAVLYQDKMDDASARAPRKHTVIFSVLADAGDAAPVVIINEFLPPAPGIVTGHVVMGKKAK